MEPPRQGWSVPLYFLSVSKPARFSLVWIFTYAALAACNILPVPPSGLTWEVSSSRKPSLNLQLWVLCSPSVLPYHLSSPIKDLITLSFNCSLTCLPNKPVFHGTKAHGRILLPAALSVAKIKSVCRGGSHMRVLLEERVVQVWENQRMESWWFTRIGAGNLKLTLRARWLSQNNENSEDGQSS